MGNIRINIVTIPIIRDSKALTHEEISFWVIAWKYYGSCNLWFYEMVLM